ncbi:hypothetical protein FRB99_000459 [Tulasnella sp. 403]|nr:hypothetical protein FRB99_000459 [Tulasnella sp. 403]
MGIRHPLFHEGADNLQHLEILGISIPWSLTSFPALRFLELRDIPEGPIISSVITFIQSQYPILEGLILDNVGVTSEPHTALVHISPLSAPALIELEIRDVDVGLARWIVESLRVHSCRYFDAKVNFREEEQPAVFVGTCIEDILLPMCNQGFISTSIPEVKLSHSLMSLKIGPRRHTALQPGSLGEFSRYPLHSFRLTFQHSSSQYAEECLGWILKAIKSWPTPPSSTVILHDGYSLAGDGSFLPLTTKLTNVHTLFLNMWAVATNLILEDLARPLMVNGVLQYPFPRLQHLTLRNADDETPRYILAMLNARGSASSEERGGVAGELVPAYADKLESLYVAEEYHAQNQEYVTKIRKLLQVELDWYQKDNRY